MSLSGYKNELMAKGDVYLGVKVFPGARETNVKEVMEDGTIKLSVKAPPNKGKANQELVKFLAKEFCVTNKKVTIINGWTSRSKLIKIKR